MILGTHNGNFHADEVFATNILMEIMDVEKVIRTRDKNELEKCNIVYDVGDGQFDHHSKDKKYRHNGIPYAACGLIWKEYGTVYIKSVLNRFRLKYTDALISGIFKKLDSTIIQQIDAGDNGVKVIEKSLNDMLICDLSNVIENFNLQWFETFTENDSDKKFMEAVDFSKKLLENKTINIYYALKGKEILCKQYEKCKKNGYIVLDEYIPWKTSIAEIDQDEFIKFIIFQGNDGNWNVQAIPKKLGEFKNRLDLPIEWAGLRNEELQNISGINDAIFCHNNLFLAVFKSKKSAVKCAEAIIEKSNNTAIFALFDENTNKRYTLDLNCNTDTLMEIVETNDFYDEVKDLEEMYGVLDFYSDGTYSGYSSYEVTNFEELLQQFKNIFDKMKILKK